VSNAPAQGAAELVKLLRTLLLDAARRRCSAQLPSGRQQRLQPGHCVGVDARGEAACARRCPRKRRCAGGEPASEPAPAASGGGALARARHCPETPHSGGLRSPLFENDTLQGGAQPTFDNDTDPDDELLELQEQNFRLMQQQQAQQLEAQAAQELAEPQPAGLRERIGFVGAGQVPALPPRRVRRSRCRRDALCVQAPLVGAAAEAPAARRPRERARSRR
jgi:hypothetical protein